MLLDIMKALLVKTKPKTKICQTFGLEEFHASNCVSNFLNYKVIHEGDNTVFIPLSRSI